MNYCCKYCTKAAALLCGLRLHGQSNIIMATVKHVLQYEKSLVTSCFYILCRCKNPSGTWEPHGATWVVCKFQLHCTRGTSFMVY